MLSLVSEFLIELCDDGIADFLDLLELLFKVLFRTIIFVLFEPILGIIKSLLD
jgi:hypothetical protein